MFVTVFELDHKNKRTINSVLNRHEMHRDIQSLFGDSRKESSNVYRVIERNGKLLLYIYSVKKVDKAQAHFGMKFLGEGSVPTYEYGNQLNIDMLVTPIRTIRCEDGKKRKRPIFNRMERITWCRRKAEENGFVIDDIAEVKKEPLQIDKHGGESPWTIDAYEYKLRATIIDAKKFANCLINGFGRNGSYGAGMIIIA